MRLIPLLLLCGLSASLRAHAQSLDRKETTVAVSFSSLRANSGPGQCGCFYLPGGNATLAQQFTTHLSVVADLGGQTGSDLDGTANGLSLLTYTAGPRVSFQHGRTTPYVQTLVGAAHAFHTYLPTSPATSSANSFALLAGGGVEIHLSRHIGLRPAQIDYLLTELPNGGSNKQNNLRFSGGVVFRVH